MREFKNEIVLCLLAKNPISAIFGERKKLLENGVLHQNDKEALSIQVLL